MTRKGLLLFVAMCVIWGVPYVLIKVAVRDFSPAELVFVRTGLGAVLLLPVAIARGALMPVLRKWPALLAFAAVEIALPWLMLTDAERRVSSSLSGLVIAGVPLVAAVGVWLLDRSQRLDARRVAGLVLGIVGVGVLLGFNVTAPSPVSVAELGVVVLGYAIGPIIASKFLSDVPRLGVVAGALSLCAVGYAPFAVPGLTGLVSRPPAAAPLVSAVLLGLVCTALAFLLFFGLLAEVGPARVTVITFVNPAVAVILGVTLLSEPFTVSTAIGSVLILAGSILATRRPRPPARRTPPVAVPEPEVPAA